jgi:DNA-directed RNA polymerase sigma subunit (sigma70/sigma32)
VAQDESENMNCPWFDLESFKGLSDEAAAALVVHQLTISPPLEVHDPTEYYVHLQHDSETERLQALHHLRTYLLRLALGISRKYPPLATSLPNAIGAIDTAIEKWDPKSGFSLGTYASWFIRQAITRDPESHESSDLD